MIRRVAVCASHALRFGDHFAVEHDERAERPSARGARGLGAFDGAAQETRIGLRWHAFLNH